MNLIKEYGLKVDQRFHQSKKEAIYFLISWVVMSAWCWAWAIYGGSMDPSNYSYVMGMPKWFFMVVIETYVAYPIFLIIQALCVKDCSLSATGEEDNVNGGNA